MSLSSCKINILKILKLRNKIYRHLNFFDIYFLGVLLYKYNLNLVINEIPKKIRSKITNNFLNILHNKKIKLNKIDFNKIKNISPDILYKFNNVQNLNIINTDISFLYLQKFKFNNLLSLKFGKEIGDIIKLPFNNEMFYNLKSLKITSNVNLDIKAYQKFPNLVEIDINYNKLLTDIKIKSFPNLIKLDASGTIITGDSIRKLEKLKEIHIDYNEYIYDEDIEHVTNQLIVFTPNNKISDRLISKCINLKKLILLNANNITDDSLVNLNNLEELCGNYKITDKSIIEKKLIKLDIKLSKNITDHGIKLLAKTLKHLDIHEYIYGICLLHCTNLVSLNISSNKWININNINKLNLIKLDCSHCDINDKFILSQKKLRKLYAYGCKRLSDLSISTLDLEKLDCSYCSKISNYGICLMKNLTHLYCKGTQINYYEIKNNNLHYIE